MSMRIVSTTLVVLAAGGVSSIARADGVLTYGDVDLVGFGWSGDPFAGATSNGLAPGATTRGTLIQGHSFPFDPAPGDFPGTDQIYVGSAQTGAEDGYSGYGGRLAGPQVFTLDYSSIAGGGVQSLTLGIGTDDFQNAVFGQPFIVRVNGQVYQPLTDLINSLDESGPVAQYVTVGLDLSLLTPANTLTLSIDEGGNGGDGWAVDFLTVGVTSVPGPGAAAAFGLAGLTMMRRRR